MYKKLQGVDTLREVKVSTIFTQCTNHHARRKMTNRKSHKKITLLFSIQVMRKYSLFQVGIGNVWRFPYLAYSNGGGTFLIPYFILLIFIGKPMYYMETAIGQFSRLSPLQVWRCAPIAKGVGYAMCVVSLIVAIYYNVIMAYSIIYIGATVQGIVDGQLPWTTCGKYLLVRFFFTRLRFCGYYSKPLFAKW